MSTTSVVAEVHDLAGLTPLMEHTEGIADILVALVDGPVQEGVPGFGYERIRGATPPRRGKAGAHGVRVAGVLVAERSAPAPGICPGCTLLVHPVLDDADAGGVPTATHEALAEGLRAAVEAGADIVNLSLALRGRTEHGEQRVREALDLAMRCGTLVVAAADNELRHGGSVLTRHPWVLPVAGYGRDGIPLPGASLDRSVGARGLGAPAEDVPTLRRSGRVVRASGTSLAAPLVAGAAALLWSSSPTATAADVRRALVGTAPRRSATPPMLAAQEAWTRLGAAG